MVKMSVVMPARIPKPLGATLIELKEHYASLGFDKDAKIIEAAILHDCTAFRFNYHKRMHKGKKVIYYISIVFDFMEWTDAMNFQMEYSSIIE